MKHIYGIGLSLLLAPWLAGCESDPASTLAVTSVEVNQGTQTSSNTVALVAERSTTVRVMLETGSSNAISNVTGLLAVKVDGAFITPVGGISAVNEPITVPAAPDRNSEDDALYFELETPSGIPESSDVDFSVVAAGNGRLISGEALDLSFVDVSTPTVYYLGIDYTPSGLGLPDPALIAPGVGDVFVRGIYPVDDGDAALYQPGLFPNITYSQDANGDGLINAGSEVNDLLSALASVRDLLVFFGVGIDNNDFLYGWLAGNPIPGNGWGGVGGLTAFGNTQASRYQRTFAHELGHNFGLNHNARALDQTGWDTAARLDNNPAANNTTGRVKPTDKFDIMVGGQLSANAWVDTTTYNVLLGSPLLALRELAARQQEAAEGVLVVQGSFNASGEQIEKVEPAFRFPWQLEPTPQQANDPYVAEAVDDAGTVHRRTFDALVGDDSEEGSERYGFFEVRIPVPPGRRVVSLRVRDADHPEQIYVSTTATAPPRLTVLSPQPGADLDATTPVTWRVADPDSKPADLQYQVAYSFDGGASWVPLAVDLEGSDTSVMVNTREVQKSDGRGVIRVFVSDGLNTDSDDVNGLSAPTAIY